MTQKPVFMEGILTLRNLRSMGAAAIVEILLASGIAAILIWQQLRPETLPPPIVGPVVNFTDPSPPLPRHVTVPEQQSPQPLPLHEVQAVQTDVPTPTTQPVQPPLSPLLPVQGSQPPGTLLSDFSTKMLRAINDQKVYPKIALLQGTTGETVISFDYVDGMASNIRVDKSSGSHELDDAAVQAVQKAALPPKPAELASLDHFVFHLEFDLGG